jgi:hypothetical protein
VLLKEYQIHAKEASQQIVANEAFLNCTPHPRGINDRPFPPWQKHVIPWLQAWLFLGQSAHQSSSANADQR